MKKRESWKSKFGFTIAAAGSAVGLANLWRFPYVVGQNGGAAFIFIYIVCLFCIGLPIFLSEILLGRKAHKNPYGAYASCSNNHKLWSFVGLTTVLIGLLVSSFYSVMAGWILGYLFEAFQGGFTHIATPEKAQQLFTERVSSTGWTVSMHIIFAGLCCLILLSGVRKGIERGSKIMMPLLSILLLVLCFHGLLSTGAERALNFLFIPSWDDLSAMTILVALGQAAFTLSLGQGTMITYGSYLSKKDNILSCAFPVAILDTVISLLAGIAIFSIVFTINLPPNAGAGLFFETLPVVFQQLPGGTLLGIAFFLLVTLAAITSEISAMEPLIAYLVDEKHWKRSRAVVACGILTILIGIPSALSTNLLCDVSIFGYTFFDAISFVVLNIMIPVSGFLVVLFVGWKWGIKKALQELRNGAEETLDKHPWLRIYLGVSIKFIAPLLILFAFFDAIGII